MATDNHNLYLEAWNAAKKKIDSGVYDFTTTNGKEYGADVLIAFARVVCFEYAMGLATNKIDNATLQNLDLLKVLVARHPDILADSNFELKKIGSEVNRLFARDETLTATYVAKMRALGIPLWGVESIKSRLNNSKVEA